MSATGFPYTVFAGQYGSWPEPMDGGITVLGVSRDGSQLEALSTIETPGEAGYLVYAPTTKTLYSVDERKTDGRGPVKPPAAVHALRFNPNDDTLSPLNVTRSVGAYPTYLNISAKQDRLLTVSHGSFDHVERVIKTAGGWSTEYLYDDATVVLNKLNADGSVGEVLDVAIFNDHGTDPNSSFQAGGHGQASGHAHCAVYHPGGELVAVCDKATDLITIFNISGDELEPLSVFDCGPETGPRHLVFNSLGTRAYATLEFSSELAAFSFDAATGRLALIGRVKSAASDYTDPNEPADLRIHPNGAVVYVNNRGEDSLAWFDVSAEQPVRLGSVPLGKSVHPGLAARSFIISPDGSFLLVADRSSSLVRSYAVSADGSLTAIGELHVPNVAYLELHAS